MDLDELKEEVRKIDIAEVWRNYSRNIKEDLEKSRRTRARSRDIRYSIFVSAA